jgi:hypothetical protein
VTAAGVLCTCPRCVPAPADGLVRRLIEAAALAIANERPSLEHQNGHVRGVTLELVLSSSGQVSEAICYVERRPKAASLLARYTGKTGKESE